jgi:hypothetical protein
MSRVARALLSAELAELANDQDQVLSRGQLSELGVDPRLIARRDGREWQTVGPHVVVLHTGSLSARQKQWVAVHHAGRESALGGLTALEADGLRGFESGPVHVVAPHSAGRRDLVTQVIHVKVHESRHLDEIDIHPARRPPRLRQPRAAVDAASWAATDGRCRAIIAAVVQQRMVLPPALRSVALAGPNLARRVLILETIDDVEGGSHSLPELDWVRGIRRVGLPTPTRQRVAQHPDGRYYIDAEFEPWAVCVEINGAQHLDLLAREADDQRRSVLSTGGRLVIDISSYTVRHDIGLAMLRTARALHSRGWRPPPDSLRELERLATDRRVELWLPPLADAARLWVPA